MTEKPGQVSPPILTTKLYPPPTRPASNIVPRLRLIERLTAGLDRAPGLTLICAPAGFGKTTLVSNWINQKDDGAGRKGDKSQIHPSNVAWLSLDDGDNDLNRFLTYFIAALQQLDPKIGQTARELLQSPQPPRVETLMTALINDISSSLANARRVLVLDDYHFIDTKAIDDALTFLLDHLPPLPGGLQLVIATRDDPYLPLARLRVQRQLTELRAADLRFTTTEAAEFLNRVMGLTLSAEDIAALEQRTEGWIAGLQLAALSMQKHHHATQFIKSFTGSHRFILDYLTEEILEQQPASIQQFLLQTSVLNRLTGFLCDALTGQSNGQATLIMLERANLFIVPLDEKRRWYRYHHLFADLLRQRLRQNQPEQAPILHRRASEWYEQSGDMDEAIGHALRAEDFERAAHLIEKQVDAVWERGEHTKLQRWLAGIPAELLSAKPHLCVFQGWYLLATGQQDAADQLLHTAQMALESTVGAGNTTPPERDRLTLCGQVSTVRAFSAFYRGDVPEIIHHARRALDYLPKQDLSWRSTATHILGDAYDFKGEMVAAYQSRLEALAVSQLTGNSILMMIASLKLAIILRHQGQLQRVQEICRQQMQLARDSGLAQTGITGWLLAIWGEVLAEINNPDEAVDLAKKGVDLAEPGADIAMLGWSYLCLIRVLFSCGDFAGAEKIAHKMEMTARESFVPPWIMHLQAAWQGRIWLAQDKLAVATQWARERDLDQGHVPTYPHEMEYIVLARILLMQGQFAEATSLLQRLLEAAEAGGRTSRMIEILALQALALHANEETDGAMTALKQTLELAEPGGFIRTFVDEGQPMARLLREAIIRGIVPGYAGKILAAFPNADALPPAQSPAAGRVFSSSIQPPQSLLVEPLSERELEVLQLIAEGLTNREIAAKLFLTVNTVKVHAHNIYGKLDAHSRTLAVAKARALGILPDI